MEERNGDIVRHKDPLYLRQLYEDFVPLSPGDLKQIFCGGISGKKRLTVELDCGNAQRKPNFKVNVNSITPGAFAISATFYVDGDKYIPGPSDITVTPSAQRQGIGKSGMRSLIELSCALGNDEYLFCAGRENGGYSWARMGADLHAPKGDYDRHMLDVLKYTLSGRAALIIPHLDPSIQDAVRERCMLRNPNDLSVLANMRGAFLPVDMLSFDQGRVWDASIKDHHVKNTPSNLWPDCSPSTEVSALGQAFNDARAQGLTSVHAARLLLVNTHWGAEVKFDNVEKITSIGEYLGGWRTAYVAPSSGESFAAQPHVFA